MSRRAWPGAAAALTAGPALAQVATYPTRPLSLVVCFAPGSSSDALAKPLAENLAVALGHSVKLDDRPGAGGALGAATVAKAGGDGHTMMLTSSHHLIGEHVYKNRPYQFAAAFDPASGRRSRPRPSCFAFAPARRSSMCPSRVAAR